ncbi:hypothetical protein GQX74_001901 [Glossina fuscipes]|nr:hypothetical protein GQX74_001901 [Glossina fuscipes]
MCDVWNGLIGYCKSLSANKKEAKKEEDFRLEAYTMAHLKNGVYDWSTPHDQYWRLFVPGTYNILAMAFGFQGSEVQKVELTNHNTTAQRLDFTLSPISNNIDNVCLRTKIIRKIKAINLQSAGSEILGQPSMGLKLMK